MRGLLRGEKLSRHVLYTKISNSCANTDICGPFSSKIFNISLKISFVRQSVVQNDKSKQEKSEVLLQFFSLAFSLSIP